MFINWPLVAATLFPNIGGWIAYFIIKKNQEWYELLKKPVYTPPNWFFEPAWSIAYCTIGYSSYAVWRDGGGFAGAAIPLSIYFVNLALNWSWTPLFYEAHKINWALYHIAALWSSTIAVGILFYHVNSIAGYFTILYFVWVTFMMLLNYGFYRNNEKILDVMKVEEKC